MKKSRYRLFTAVCFFIVLIAGLQSNASTANLVIYGDSLGAGWDNWSWSATINPAATSPFHAGTHSMAVRDGK